MIIMVSLSVFATVTVINLSSRSQEPVPKWMKWIVFEKLPYLLFLSGFVKVARANISDSKSTTFENHSVVKFQRSHGSSLFPAVVGGFNNNHCPQNGFHAHRMNGGNRDDNKHDQEPFAKDWYLVGLIVSRFFALFFGLIVTLSTGIILFYIWYQSKIDFDKAVGRTKDQWLAQNFSLIPRTRNSHTYCKSNVIILLHVSDTNAACNTWTWDLGITFVLLCDNIPTELFNCIYDNFDSHFFNKILLSSIDGVKERREILKSYFHAAGNFDVN